MRQRHNYLGVVGAALLALSAESVRAEVPAEIPIQGVLAETDGTRREGPVTMTFALYLSANAPAPFWTETQTVTVSDGFFSSYLGKSTPIDLAHFADADGVFVGVAVDGAAEMGRLRLASTAFAFRADSAGDAETLGGESANAFARANESCKPGQVMNGIGANGGPSCVADQDTLYTGSAFALSAQQCQPGDVVRGISDVGALVCGDIELGITCEDGEVLTYGQAVGWTCGAPGIEGFEESDPMFSASAAKSVTTALIAQWNQAVGWGDHKSAGYIKAEADPAFTSSAAKDITSVLIAQWNQAAAWGDHSDAGYLENETDPVFNGSAAKTVTATLMSQWSQAFGWGDHKTASYLKTESDPTFAASAAKNIGGTQINNWNAAYGWGDHSQAGYLEIESDPAFNASAAKSVTDADLTKWNAAHGWGDHGAAGYLKQAVFAASVAGGITATQVTNWNAAYGWGNHASAGYLKTETAHPADSLSQQEVDQLRVRIPGAYIGDIYPYSQALSDCQGATTGGVPLAVPPSYAGIYKTGHQWCALNIDANRRTCKGMVAGIKRLDGVHVVHAPSNLSCDQSHYSPWPFGYFLNNATTSPGEWGWPFTYVVCCGAAN